MESEIRRDCPKSPNGIHRIKRAPPTTQEEINDWWALTDDEREESQFCIYCGKTIW